ncbi:hypothetical protein Pedsa_0279 [Pseudopedobacter saltans DSM 12145]|uniref:Uncharacterized protein n=1 Tax=Pseudopedobacter saltans (strain ATCC 51119 / DSM 12145 / JCM 21818 / CCUG 39354 / LMG 10337 / NBRC 100064 / NCIMB 13643) TaxID=762903 RepID=F0S4A7_PSESL|nr:hypothetical protein Pedsa_0279 [Pseudopedobacter saltans DSM 12145]
MKEKIIPFGDNRKLLGFLFLNLGINKRITGKITFKNLSG